MSASNATVVSAAESPAKRHPPEYRYHLLRAALAENRGGLAGLAPERLDEAGRKADKTFELESLVLGSAEAAKVTIPPARLNAAVGELQSRYSDREAFLDDLARNGLDEETVRRALQRELVFDAAMQQVAARRPDVNDLDLRLFFELHRERFTRPEQRAARHILITVNDDFAENRRAAARARIEQVAGKLAGKANRFSSLARRYSECPSAMEGGRLGTVARGQLYPEVDKVLFRLAEDRVGGPVESELGFHLVWCEKVLGGQSIPFAKARERIREVLEARTARNCQKDWIARLRREQGTREAA
jgi:peptidyl-prolyl cis-trans isomerase C